MIKKHVPSIGNPARRDGTIIWGTDYLWHEEVGDVAKKKSPPDTDKPSKLGIPGQERKGLATLQQRIAKSKPCGCLLHGTVRFV